MIGGRPELPVAEAKLESRAPPRLPKPLPARAPPKALVPPRELNPEVDGAPPEANDEAGFPRAPPNALVVVVVLVVVADAEPVAEPLPPKPPNGLAVPADGVPAKVDSLEAPMLPNGEAADWAKLPKPDALKAEAEV